MEIIRSFIAIEIPGRVRSEITRLMNKFAQEDRSVRWVKYDNLHITLLFLGDVTEAFLKKAENEIAQIAKQQKSFEISLYNIGAFPNPGSPRIIWIGVKDGNKEIIDLESKIETAFTNIGHKPEERKFHPHLTIGRVKFRFNNPKIFETNYKSDIFPVKSVILFKSTLKLDGPVYEKLNEFNFS